MIWSMLSVTPFTTYKRQWRSQKFSTGGALISGFPSYPHNPLLIYLIHYVTKYFSEKYVRIMRKIRLDDSCLNHLTNIPVGFTRKSSYIYICILRNHIPKILCILLTGGAYAPEEVQHWSVLVVMRPAQDTGGLKPGAWSYEVGCPYKICVAGSSPH